MSIIGKFQQSVEASNTPAYLTVSGEAGSEVGIAYTDADMSYHALQIYTKGARLAVARNTIIYGDFSDASGDIVLNASLPYLHVVTGDCTVWSSAGSGGSID